jgi:arylamine N-acetyltransferase
MSFSVEIEGGKPMPLLNAAILAYLELTAQPPSIDFLNEILAAWSRRIPWESASRIARHQIPGTPETYARIPEAFFRDALRLGTGSTCFESNLALGALLQSLGFICTLAFCDMSDEYENPHCAVIVRDGRKLYLADAGYPIPAVLPLDNRQSTRVDVPVYTYFADPLEENCWKIHRTSGTIEGDCFTLKALPVDDVTFWNRLLRDHEPDGLFLEQVIISKHADDQIVRYSPDKGLIRRYSGFEEPVTLTAEQQEKLSATLAEQFGMNESVIRAALTRTAPADLLAEWGDT